MVRDIQSCDINVYIYIFSHSLFSTILDLMNGHFLDCLVLTSFLLQKKLNVILIVALHTVFTRIRFPRLMQGNLFFYSLARFLFYALGNSNGIATVDISHSYIGLSEFQYYLTGLLTFYNTFFAPIYVMTLANLISYEDGRKLWLNRAFLQLYGSRVKADNATEVERRRGSSREKLELDLDRAVTIMHDKKDWNEKRCHFYWFIVFHLLYELLVMISCFSFRNHLFVWSVFSPKIIVSKID